MRACSSGSSSSSSSSSSRLAPCSLSYVRCYAPHPPQAAGHNVSAWTRTPRTLPPGVKGYCGQDQLQAFAAQADIVICLVPLTPSTR